MAQQVTGNYQILEEIASGGQGTVFRAFDSRTNQIVAVKVLHSLLTIESSYLERFHREARIAASINHPNVVRIFEVGEDNGQHFIAMEFLPESLARVIEMSVSLPIDSAARFSIQIAEGLAAAHSLGVVHRDVKPQNVLIGPDGSAKVTDFGIARAESLTTMTATGMVMGTPQYMSPEQARGEQADARSDVYSLGCIIYQMLAGEVPFQGTTPLAVLRQHIDDRPRSVQELRRDVPRDFARVVEKALEKNPDRRFQSPIELVDAVEEAVPGIARRQSSLPDTVLSDRPSERPFSPREAITPSSAATEVERPQGQRSARTSKARYLVIFIGVLLALWGVFLLITGGFLMAELDAVAGALVLVSSGFLTLAGAGLLFFRNRIRLRPFGIGRWTVAIVVLGLIFFVGGTMLLPDQKEPEPDQQRSVASAPPTAATLPEPFASNSGAQPKQPVEPTPVPKPVVAAISEPSPIPSPPPVAEAPPEATSNPAPTSTVVPSTPEPASPPASTPIPATPPTAAAPQVPSAPLPVTPKTPELSSQPVLPTATEAATLEPITKVLPPTSAPALPSPTATSVPPAPTFTPSPEIPLTQSDGLVSWWTGDGNSDDVVAGYHGIRVGGTSFALGRVGQAFSFDGIDDYIEIAHNPNLDLPQEVTMEMWIYPHSWGGVWRGIFAKRMGEPKANYGINAHEGIGSFNLYFGDGRSWKFLSVGEFPQVNQWTHLTGTLKQSDANEVEAKLFFNGELVGFSTIQGSLSNSVLAAPVTIGRDGDIADSFHGLIDELRLYDRALSESEIKAIFQATSDE